MSRLPLRASYSLQAEEDLNRQADYMVDNGSPSASERFVDSVAHTVSLLEWSPGLGRRLPSRGGGASRLRWIAVSGSFGGWLVFYTYTETDLRVERVLNGVRDLSALIEDL